VTTGRYGHYIHPVVTGLTNLRTKAEQIAHAGEGTKHSTDTLVGIEKNRKTRIINNIDVRTTLNVSASQIASQVNRYVRNGGMVPI